MSRCKDIWFFFTVVLVVVVKDVVVVVSDDNDKKIKNKSLLQIFLGYPLGVSC